LKVRVRVFATLKDAIGSPEVEVELGEEASVGQLLSVLSRRYGKAFSERVLSEREELLPYVKVFVGGRDIDFLNKLGTVLRDGDEISLFPPVRGG